MTNIGQMPLEGPFVELVSTLAKEGTVIAAILPNTHFTTKGESSQAIRKMLLDTFGLQLIFNYPQEGLFKEVAQNTSIVLGIKGSQSSEVRYLYCNVAISEVDAKSIEQVMATNLSGDRIVDINGQFEGILISRHELQATVKNGWKLGNMSKHEALQFITDAIGHSSCLTPLKNSEFRDYSRGKIGNEGCTDLLFLKANDTFLTIAEKQLQGHLKVGLNRAKYDLVDIGSGDSFFLDVSDMTDRQIMTIIKKFLEVKSSKKEKKQRRDKKSPDEYLEILKRESTNVTHAYSVMLPRSIRSSGRVFYTTQQAFVSTNFFVIQADEKKSRILSSWFSTIFYQLECEVFGNNRKGLRKMEKEDFEPLHVPIIAQLTDEQTRKIISTPITEFVNLRVPQPRAIDHVWAEILFGERAQEYIEKVLLFLPILAEDREK